MKSNNTPVICGFSGTMKSTISKITFSDRRFIETPTKFMQDFNKRIGGLCMNMDPLQGFMMRTYLLSNIHDEKLVVERSLYDYAYFSILSKVPMFDKVTDFNYREMNSVEWDLLGDRDYYLIINKAPNFTEKYIISNKELRCSLYNNLDEYNTLQDDYIKFLSIFINFKAVLVLTDELANNIINDRECTIPWKFSE